MSNNKLTASLQENLPAHIVNDYPRLVEFMKGYYEWLSYEGNPYNSIAKHIDRFNMDETLDEYVRYLKYEYLYNIPESVIADKKKMIHFSKNFASYIGTDQSFEFLFRVLYDEEVQVLFPKENILRTSDGRWVQNEIVVYTTNTGYELSELLYKTVSQTYEITEGVTTTVTGVVGNVIAKTAGNYQFLELRVINLSGDIIPEQRVVIDDMVEYVLSVGADYDIIDGGSGYISGDVLEILNPSVYTKEFTDIQQLTIDTQVTTTFTESDIVVRQGGVVTTNFSFNGRYLTLDSFTAGETVEIDFPRYDGLIVVNEVDMNGTIESVNIIQAPIGVTENNKLFSSTNGINIDLYAEGTKLIEGYYRGTRGQLSSYSVLQDSDYYQDYSYVLRTAMDIEIYRDVVEQVLHPAGMKMFGEISIFDLINVAVSLIDSRIYYEMSTYWELGYCDTKYVSENYGYI